MPMGCRVIRAATAMVLVGVMAVLASGVAGAQQPVATGTLRGRVVDAVTGDVVPRARLRLTAYGMTAVADDLGVYVFTGVPVGATTLIASAPGYRDYTQNIQVFGGEQTLDVLLTPVGAPAGRPVPAPTPTVAPPPRPQPTWGLYVAGGYGTLAMKEVNAEIIDEANGSQAQLEQNPYFPSWLKVDKFERIESGFFGELGVRFGGGPLQLMLGGQYLRPNPSRGGLGGAGEELLACESESDVCLYTVGDVSASFEFSASVLGAVARVGFTSRGPVRLGGFAGGGWYQARLTQSVQGRGSVAVELRDAVTGQVLGSSPVLDLNQLNDSDGWTGSGFGFEGGLQLGLALSETAELRLGASYASLVIRDFKGSDTEQGDEPPPPFDLSGIRAFAGLSLGF